MDSFDRDHIRDEKRAFDLKWEIRRKQIDDLRQSWADQDLQASVPPSQRSSLDLPPAILDRKEIDRRRQADDCKRRARLQQEEFIRQGWVEQDLKEEREKPRSGRLKKGLL